MKTIFPLKLFFVLFLYFPFFSQSLERDYCYQGSYIYDDQEPDEYEEDYGNIYYYSSNELCLSCFFEANWDQWTGGFPYKHKKELNLDLIPVLNESQRYTCGCLACYEYPIYSGYLHFRYKGDYPFLKRQIEYTNRYPKYQAYWPETSFKAEKINDIAVILFKDLVDSTVLKKVTQQTDLSKDFITDSWYFGKLRSITLPRSLYACCFRFSDFFLVCNDLRQFSQTHFSEKECILIESKIDEILDKLSGMFFEMYNESLTLHPTEEIQEEVDFIEFIYKPSKELQSKASRSRFSEKANHFYPNEASINIFGNKKYQNLKQKNKSSYETLSCSAQPDWFMSEFLLWKAVVYNDLFLYSDAIEALNEAIRIDPGKIDAYKERVHAYFELDKLDLAIEDYRKVKELEKQQPPFIGSVIDGYVVSHKGLCPKGRLDYAGGFCVGTLEGGCVALKEFVPSTLSCCRGVLHGLWSFACSPGEVSKEVISASYTLVEYLKTHTTMECLETAVPELKDLCLHWDSLSDYDRGEKVGYIIGKYGVDVLAPSAAISGINKFRHLKRANTLFTVESCAVSQSKRAKIIERCSMHAEARKVVCEAVKRGKVVPRNASVITHVMQEKHAWNKLIKPSGNLEGDFKKVIALLEENSILSEKCFLRSREFYQGKIIRSDYKKVINWHEVQAVFETYAETNQTFLKDAWIVTK